MTAVGVLLVGAGCYLMYYAVRNKTAGVPTSGPVAHAKTELGKLSG